MASPTVVRRTPAVLTPMPGIEVGTQVQADVARADLESTERVSDVVAQVSGTVLARKDALEQCPKAINSDPYEHRWLLDTEVDPSKVSAELSTLQDPAGHPVRPAADVHSGRSPAGGSVPRRLEEYEVVPSTPLRVR